MASRRGKVRELPTWKLMESDDVLVQYPVEFLLCRGGHDWPRSGEGVIWVQIGPNLVERRCTCRSCGSTQVKEINSKTWRRTRPQARIRYVPGYQTATGLTQADFEATSYERDFDLAVVKGRVFDSKEG